MYYLIAESPPKPGNGFFYDQSSESKFRDVLFDYINLSGLGFVNSIEEFSNKGYYLADVINCRWDKDKQKQISNKAAGTCAQYLAKQIGLFKP
jgi:hypothetical protein